MGLLVSSMVFTGHTRSVVQCMPPTKKPQQLLRLSLPGLDLPRGLGAAPPLLFDPKTVEEQLFAIGFVEHEAFKELAVSLSLQKGFQSSSDDPVGTGNSNDQFPVGRVGRGGCPEEAGPMLHEPLLDILCLTDIVSTTRGAV